jgi:hypothetical protein
MADIEAHLRMLKSYEETNILAFGEYTFPGGEKFIARYKFFNEINNIAPDVFEELDKFIQPYILLLPTMRKLSGYKKNNWFYWRDILNFSKLNGDCKQFANGLNEWAESWNLNEEWIISSALLTIISWSKEPALKEKRIIHPTGDIPKYYHRLIEELRKMMRDAEYPAPPIYSPVINFPDQYDDMVMEYKKKMKMVYEKYGWRKSPVKRIKDIGVEINRDFEWVVKYQILKHDYKTIVSDHYDTYLIDTNDNTVMKAINRTAEIIGISLRKPYKK